MVALWVVNNIGPLVAVIVFSMIILTIYIKKRPKKRKIKGWLVRQRWGTVWLFYNKKPCKDDMGWFAAKGSDNAMSELGDYAFPEVEVDDEEPTEVKIVIKRKKK